MRLSEICGLQNKDIDLINKRIYVRQTYKNRNGKIELAPTKTHRSKRPIAMLPGIDIVIKKYMQQKNINKMNY